MQAKIPGANEKDVLRKAGLGYKKIKLDNDDTEESVIQKLMSPTIPEDGFPQLKQAGGFELTRTQQCGRQLTVIDSPWTSAALKSKVGPQARIYVRPIQNSLETIPKESESGTVREQCATCRRSYLLNEMRTHVDECSDVHSPTYLDDESSNMLQTQLQLPVFNNNNVNVDSIIDATINSGLLITTQAHSPVEYVANNINVESGILSSNNVIADTQTQFSELNNHNIVIDSFNIDFESPVTLLPDISTVNSLNIYSIIAQCRAFENPIEILKKLQQEIVCGRALEVADESAALEGDTNYIFVDRDKILETGMEEIKGIENIRMTLEVKFYNEVGIEDQFISPPPLI